MWKNLTNVQKGLYLALGTAMISGVSVFLNKFATDAVGNSSVFATVKVFIVAMILSLIVLTPHVADEFIRMVKKDWLKLAFIGIIGGSIPFLLFFEGLLKTTSVNAAFIHKTLFIWVALLAWPFLKERFSKIQLLAFGILILSNFLLTGKNYFNFNIGSLYIFGATLLWAVEFVYAKKLLKTVDPKVLAWGRMFFGSIILIIFLLFTNQFQHIFTLNGEQWSWIVLTSVLLLGYVLTWYHSIKYLPISIVSCLLVFGYPITSLLNRLWTCNVQHWQQVAGNVAIIVATGLLYYFGRQIKSNESTTVQQSS